MMKFKSFLILATLASSTIADARYVAPAPVFRAPPPVFRPVHVPTYRHTTTTRTIYTPTYYGGGYAVPKSGRQCRYEMENKAKVIKCYDAGQMPAEPAKKAVKTAKKKPIL